LIVHRIPPTVTLPSAPMIEHQHLRIALDYPSRQLLNVWRKTRRFPKTHRDGKSSFSMTSEIEAWLITQGCRVKRI
jgi:hypothetical protein